MAAFMYLGKRKMMEDWGMIPSMSIYILYTEWIYAVQEVLSSLASVFQCEDIS